MVSISIPYRVMNGLCFLRNNLYIQVSFRLRHLLPMSVYASVFISTVASALRPVLVTNLALQKVCLVSSVDSFLLYCREMYTGEVYFGGKPARPYL